MTKHYFHKKRHFSRRRPRAMRFKSTRRVHYTKNTPKRFRKKLSTTPTWMNNLSPPSWVTWNWLKPTQTKKKHSS
jgi:hypothetical protein